MASSKDDTKNKRSPIPKGFTQTSLPKTIVEDTQGLGLLTLRSLQTANIFVYLLKWCVALRNNTPYKKSAS